VTNRRQAQASLGFARLAALAKQPMLGLGPGRRFWGRTTEASGAAAGGSRADSRRVTQVGTGQTRASLQVRRASRKAPACGKTAARDKAHPKRRRVDQEVAADVRFAVDDRCCMCEPVSGAFPPRVRNGQLHHLDENPSNNGPDNLVWLCLEHHEEAGKVGKASRRLSAGTIRRYRSLLQKKVTRERTPLQARSGRRVFSEALDALVVLNVRKLRGRAALEGDGEEVELLQALSELGHYPESIGFEARREILELLCDVASDTRHRMPALVAFMIRHHAIDVLRLHYLYSGRTHRTTHDRFALLEYGIQLGANMAYDGALYLHSVKIVDEGCEILWRLLSYATIHKHRKLRAAVLDGFETALDGATRSGSKATVALVETAKRYGESGGMRSPEYPRFVNDEL
jgi:hypothetical protein